MLGSATLTIETSSSVMKPAARQMLSAIQRSGSGRYPSPPGGAGGVEGVEGTGRGSSIPESMVSRSGVSRVHSDGIAQWLFIDCAVGQADP
jgi:hypothetical protein